MPSDLPIITPPPPPRTRTDAQRFGSLFYVGLTGLILLVSMLVWFGLSVWSLRGVFHDVYVLHDTSRSEADRVQAAYALSRDRNATPQQIWEIALRKDLPPLARYVLAESLTHEAVLGDTRGYILTVMRSPNWPGWLRVLLMCPLADSAAQEFRLPKDLVGELPRSNDPYVPAYAAFTIAALYPTSAEGRPALEQIAATDGPTRELAKILLETLDAPPHRRTAILDRSKLWLRSHHPEAVRIWDDWEESNGQLVRKPTVDRPA